MYFSWLWQSPESLLGIVTANGVNVQDDTGTYSASLISIGIFICRLDLIINKEKIGD